MLRAHFASPELLDQIVAALVAKYQPRRVYLFGSRARGDAHRYSDYDFLVEVERTPGGHAQTRHRITWLDDFPGTEIQVHIRYPGQLERRKDDPGTIDWDVIREGRVLFEAEGLPLILPAPNRGMVRELRRDPPPALAEWLRLAEQDLSLVQHLSADLERWKEPICFHAQQSAEKFLKAAMVSQWKQPLFTHSLRDLLRAAQDVGFPLRDIGDDCLMLSRFAVVARYPADDDPFDVADGLRLSASDASEAVAAAERVAKAVRSSLP